MKRLAGLGVIVLVVLTAGCKDTSSSSDAEAATSAVVVVPNVQGLAGDDAKDRIRKLGLRANLVDGLRDRSVMVASRWVVIAQDPEGRRSGCPRGCGYGDGYQAWRVDAVFA